MGEEVEEILASIDLDGSGERNPQYVFRLDMCQFMTLSTSGIINRRVRIPLTGHVSYSGLSWLSTAVVIFLSLVKCYVWETQKVRIQGIGTLHSWVIS